MKDGDSHPLVSVVMPVRNGEATLVEAIESILAQTLVNFELIIVDDGSTDGTADILYSYQAKDARVRICPSKGEGISAARNSGLALALAPLYACMDADDISAPKRFARQVAEFDRRPTLQLLGSQCHTFNDNDDQRQLVCLPTGNDTLQQAIKINPTFFHPSIMARTASVRSIGGYRSAFDGAEDHDLYLRIARLGEIDILDACLLDYRLHPGQTTQIKKSRSHVASAAALYLAMQKADELKDDSMMSETELDIDMLALAFVEHLAKSTSALSPSQQKLALRTLKALSKRGQHNKNVAKIRNKMLFQSIKRFEIKNVLKFLYKAR